MTAKLRCGAVMVLAKLHVGASGFLLGKGCTPQQVDRGEEMMESPPRLGLGTIYIVPLHERTNLITEVWVWSLGMFLGRC